ncbi:MAG: iron-containing alcohol dehydrogenase [Chloroflexota bacterium]
MQNYTFSLPTRVVFGPGSVELVGREVSRLGGRAMVVTGSTFARRSGLIERIRGSLTAGGMAVEFYDRLGAKPGTGAIDEAAAKAREAAAEVIVGVGGGSVMDAAKGIAVSTSSGRPIWEHVRGDSGQTSHISGALPLVQVPIVASTGSETSDTAVIVDDCSHKAAWLQSAHLFARVAVVDPTLTFTVPPAYTAVGAMNIVSQMLETYVTADEFPVTDRGLHPEPQGNLLLDEMLGAHIRWVESDDPADAAAGMESLASELREQGRRPLVIPRGGSVPQGATGYAACVPELLSQLAEMNVQPTHVYLATGSTGTHSGVLAGMTAVDSQVPVQGISVSRDAPQQRAKVLDLTNRTLEHLGLGDRARATDVLVDDRFRGPGYGIPTEQTLEAIRILAEDEAILLDPVYTGKAMAGLIGHAGSGKLGSDDTIVFVHTGGAPALFAYNHEITDSLRKRIE